MRVVVVGAGVSGLTCAHELLAAGHDVEIWAADPPLQTTSVVAAAVWYPLRGEREPRAEAWMRASLERFLDLARDRSTGVLLRSGIELFRGPADDDGWRDLLPGFRHATADELPPGYVDGFVADGVPVIDMPIYLAWLAARVEARGARIERRAVDDLRIDGVDAVVNCAGLGGRALCEDETVRPVRGQVVRVAQFGLERYILDEANPEGLVYIYPRTRDVVLGGTREDGDWERMPRRRTAREIIARCLLLEPRLAGADVLSHGVGLRPVRPRVRLEAEELDGVRVVHDYGHGGSGVTLSWGCASEVARLVAGGAEAGKAEGRSLDRPS